MPPTSTADIRRAYLEFFRKNGHAIISGASLIPENDPTVLFTTAGMHPLVPYLMGEEHPNGKRLVDVQLCVRTQDIDEVGDAEHLTCFEMLGNWSLGDYFKKGAIEMSFEFLTEILGMEVAKLAVTCFEGDKDAPRDEESAGYWQQVGIPSERIGFLPKAKNWWGPAGKTGPCGPDTEMFYWVGDFTSPDGLRGARPQGNPATHPDCWMEIWNDVFMQYNRREGEKGKEGKEEYFFEPLSQQNVDTGMGLERVAAVVQGVKSVYETDAFRPLVEVARGVHTLDDTELGTSLTRHVRIIVDHLKAATFMIADGVQPSNVDQGYVLRKIIRRAIRSLRRLNVEVHADFAARHYCSEFATAVIKEYGPFYTHLQKKEDAILATFDREEQQFKRTLVEGLKHYEKVAEGGIKTIDGITAFHLYDTYGFPIEMTRDLASESGCKVDEDGFRKAFEAHQHLSRAGAEQRFAGGLADHSSETTKLHTATHLLHAALRQVLGNHVFQKGSNITTERLRFDFNHPQKMTPEQIKQVEDLVNEAIKADVPVRYSMMTVDEAKASGAIGVFESKYASLSLSTGSEHVKVYTMGDDPQSGTGTIPQSGHRAPISQPGRRVPGRVFSKEICGGPHVARTGMLGHFTIQKEESSSAGVRRIKAVVSGGPKEIGVATEET